MSIFDFIRFLVMSDDDFNREYNGTNVQPYQNQSTPPLQTTQAQNVTINLGSELQKMQDQAAKAQDEKCYIEQIEALSELHKKGILTDEEFSRKKQNLLEP